MSKKSREHIEFSISYFIIATLLKYAQFSLIYFVYCEGWCQIWLLPLAVLTIQFAVQAKRKRRIAKAEAKQKLNYDLERCDWINKALGLIWPYLSENISTVLKKEIEPKLASSFGAIYFIGIDVGKLSPRVRGIKVHHTNINRNEIAILVDFTFASDCNISFNAGGMNGSIRDFKISCGLNLTLRPLLNKQPFVGGIEITLLHNPFIDFELDLLVGVFDFFGLPSTMIRRAIVEKIAAVMVMPNKLYIPVK